MPPLTFIEMTSTVPREPLEVVLRSDVRVRVRDDFDAHTLDRLLDVLALLDQNPFRKLTLDARG